MPGTSHSLVLTCREAAAALRLGQSTVRGLIARGELRIVRFGRSVRIPRDALEEFVRTRSQAPASAVNAV